MAKFEPMKGRDYDQFSCDQKSTLFINNLVSWGLAG